MPRFDFNAIKQSFFDSEKVIKSVAAGERKSQAKFGAFVRRKAKSSMRKRKRSAEPGEPPSRHVGTLAALLFFSWDQQTHSTVVGPVPFRGRAVVPGLMERGGEHDIEKPDGRRRHAKYAPHPYMKPALDAETPKFAEQMKGSMT